MASQVVLILDFGGQYNQLIARRVREANVYCEVKPCTTPLSELMKYNPIGFIFTGGPQSVYAEGSPQVDPKIFTLGLPILGICYGCQLIAHHLGGKVTAAQDDTAREYGKTETFFFDTSCELFHGLKEQSITWMSHGDYMAKGPEGKTSPSAPILPPAPFVGICDETRKIYGVQFHLEVNHYRAGLLILRNFLYRVCKASGDWTMADYRQNAIRKSVKRSAPARHCLRSPGRGLLRRGRTHGRGHWKSAHVRLCRPWPDAQGRGDEVEAAFSKMGHSLHPRKRGMSASSQSSPAFPSPRQSARSSAKSSSASLRRKPRKSARLISSSRGTIYPDVIESGLGNSAVIKSHHNVGGLPDYVDFFKEIIEPLRMLFKDEVRGLGRELGLPEYLVMRQPFPGPGLAIRVIGDITKKSSTRCARRISSSATGVAKAGFDRQMNQYFAVLTSMRSVGVMGDGRTYDYTLALRGVTTSDFMTADWARIPYDVLDRVSVRIVNEVRGINRIVYDITSKPPATISGNKYLVFF